MNSGMALFTRLRFHLKMETNRCGPPSVYTETMKTIVKTLIFEYTTQRPRLHGYVFIFENEITKTQKFQYAIQSGSIWKRNEMKTER